MIKLLCNKCNGSASSSQINNLQVLDLAKEEQTRRMICEGWEVGKKGGHIDHQTLRLSEGRGYALVYILCRA